MPQTTTIETDLREPGILQVAGRREPVSYVLMGERGGRAHAASGRLIGPTGLLTAARMMPASILKTSEGDFLEIVLTAMYFGRETAAEFTVPEG